MLWVEKKDEWLSIKDFWYFRDNHRDCNGMYEKCLFNKFRRQIGVKISGVPEGCGCCAIDKEGNSDSSLYFFNQFISSLKSGNGYEHPLGTVLTLKELEDG